MILLSMLGGLLISGLALALFYQIIYWLPGRYLLPGLSAATLLIVLGWSAFLVRRIAAIITWTVIASMIVLDLLIPGQFLAPLFVPPPTIDEAAISHYGPGELAPGVEILGYDAPSKMARPGEEIELRVYWKADYTPDLDYTVRVELIGQDNQNYGLLDTYPAYGVYPTSRWAVEVPFRDSYLVRINPSFPAPAVAHFQISMMRDDFERTRVLDDLPVQIH